MRAIVNILRLRNDIKMYLLLWKAAFLLF